ncbi:hypothetical protein PsYK624_013850 [Phanerochaete sordida]|uniref:Uncharacterized protein n=1 Tax=Phanerochaete sordida TaxID=48140 RepID=A0A9P3FZ95_9APHY|nr:hypothetical protein PsYK624_013850 [Phanerochaete sordida]
MSSPIAIPRAASSSSLSSSHDGVYVPVHRRRDASRSPSPTPAPATSESWREHKPSKAPSAAFRSKRQPTHKKTPSVSSASSDHSHDTQIPAPTSIPARRALPNTYSVRTLLALASAPAELAPEKLAALRALTAYTVFAAQDKPAPRRRRTGRQGKKPQPAAVALQAADVDARRARHGHGTWGWHQYPTDAALQSHEHALEVSWRHAPQPHTVEIVV